MATKLAPLPPGATKPNTVTHRKGQHLLLTSGEYSDYSVNSVLRVKRDCDLTWLAVQYTLQVPVKRNPRTNEAEVLLDISIDSFVAWLLAQGWVTEIETDEINLDSYAYYPTVERFGANIDVQVRNRRATKVR